MPSNSRTGMLLNPGDTVVSSNSRQTFVIETLVGAGGEAEVYRAKNVSSGERSAVKIFYDRGQLRRKRIEQLVALRLHEKSPGLHCAPREMLDAGEHLGHVGPLAKGQPLVSLLEETPFSMLASLGLAISIVAPLVKLEEQSLGHGDVHIGNTMAESSADNEIIRVTWVDFDNFIAPNLACLMLGPETYAAPELCDAFQAGRPINPTLGSDRFSLGLLLADVIFRKHVQTCCEPNSEWRDVVRSGIWPLDPAYRKSRESDSRGVPVLAANDTIIQLFRRAFSRDPAQRPSAAVWYAELGTALELGIYECDHCLMPSMLEPTRTSCPWPGCRCPQRRLALKPKGRDPILIDRPRVVLGRAELGGSAAVSRRQLVLVRVGLEVLCEAVGRNSTYFWEGGWKQVMPSCPLSLEAGDRLRTADVELDVIEV